MSKDFDVKLFEKIWQNLKPRVQNEQAKYWVEKCNDKMIHSINKLCVYRLSSELFIVINIESLHCKFYSTEDESINYCLDLYPKSFFNNQTKLFEFNP